MQLDDKTIIETVRRCQTGDLIVRPSSSWAIKAQNRSNEQILSLCRGERSRTSTMNKLKQVLKGQPLNP